MTIPLWLVWVTGGLIVALVMFIIVLWVSAKGLRDIAAGFIKGIQR